MMSIAIISTSFPRICNDPSGHFVGHFVEKYASSLLDGNNQIHLIVPGRFSKTPQISTQGFWIHLSGGDQLFRWPGALSRVKENPFRLLQSISFLIGSRYHLHKLGKMDEIIAHWMIPSAWPLLVGMSAPSLRIICHGADVRLFLKIPRMIRIQIIQKLLAKGATFQFVARTLRDQCIHSLPDSVALKLLERSTIYPCPIFVPNQPEEARKCREQLHLDGEEILLVSVGRLIESKRVDLTLESVSFCKKPVRLVVIGDGPKRKNLEQQANLLNIKVHWQGQLPRNQTLAWIQAADCLIHTSKEEGAPTVVREARSLGTIVLACSSGDIEEWSKMDPEIHIVEPHSKMIGESIVQFLEPAPSLE